MREFPGKVPYPRLREAANFPVVVSCQYVQYVVLLRKELPTMITLLFFSCCFFFLSKASCNQWRMKLADSPQATSKIVFLLPYHFPGFQFPEPHIFSIGAASLGRKTKRGFICYPKQRPAPTLPCLPPACEREHRGSSLCFLKCSGLPPCLRVGTEQLQ